MSVVGASAAAGLVDVAAEVLHRSWAMGSFSPRESSLHSVLPKAFV